MKISLTFCCTVVMTATISVVASRSDYCAMSCQPHIGCNHNKLFAESCPENAKMVTMTEWLKKLLVDGHNEKRHILAGGDDRNHRPVCLMHVLEWDNELAELADLNVKQCQARSDNCLGTDSSEYTGQNIYLRYREFHSPVVFDDAKLLQNAIEHWYEEIQYNNQKIVHDTKNGNSTVMMCDRNTHLGCAAATYQIGVRYHYLITCNYAYINMLKRPVYASRDNTGTECASGRHQPYNNL